MVHDVSLGALIIRESSNNVQFRVSNNEIGVELVLDRHAADCRKASGFNPCGSEAAAVTENQESGAQPRRGKAGILYSQKR
jgi:hypothetical protein